jgi:hypothetical protein
LIAQHVGTKSPAQCVQQFLRLPIEEPFLEDALTEHVQPSACSRSIQPAHMPGQVLIAMLNVVNKSIDPEIARTAANAALGRLGELARSPVASGHASHAHGPPWSVVRGRVSPSDLSPCGPLSALPLDVLAKRRASSHSSMDTSADEAGSDPTSSAEKVQVVSAAVFGGVVAQAQVGVHEVTCVRVCMRERESVCMNVCLCVRV